MTVSERARLKKNHVRMGKRDIIYNVIAVCFFTLVGLICFYPFYYLMICTISEQKMVDLNQIMFLPHGINFKNYVEIYIEN